MKSVREEESELSTMNSEKVPLKGREKEKNMSSSKDGEKD